MIFEMMPRVERRFMPWGRFASVNDSLQDCDRAEITSRTPKASLGR
jgi:hypothetical protein